MSIEKIVSTGISNISRAAQKKTAAAAPVLLENSQKSLSGLDALAKYNMHLAQKTQPDFMLDSKTLELIKDELSIFRDDFPDDATISFAVSNMCDKSKRKSGYDLQGIFVILDKLSEKTPEEREKLFNSEFLSFAFSVIKEKGFKFTFFEMPIEKLRELDSFAKDDFSRHCIRDFLKQKDDPFCDINICFGDLKKILSDISDFSKEKFASEFYSLLSTRKYQDVSELCNIISCEFKKCPKKDTKELEALFETLLNAKTPTGEFIFGTSDAGDRASKTMLDGIENILLSRCENPEKFKQLMEILELTKQGKVPPSVLGTLAKKGEINPEFLTKTINAGKNIGILKFSDKTTAITQTKDGEVVQIGEELFYKNKDSLQSLKLDADTFEALFPQIKTMALEQGKLGDCYLVSGILDFLKNPDFKNVIYQMFEKDGNDIIVRIPDAKEFPIRFTDGVLKKDGDKNINASLGIQMLEEAYKQTRALKYGTADKLSAIEGGSQANVYRAFLPEQNAKNYFVADGDVIIPKKDDILEFTKMIDDEIRALSSSIKPDLKESDVLLEQMDYLLNEDLKKRMAHLEAEKRALLEDGDVLDSFYEVSCDELLEKLIEKSQDSSCLVSLGSKCVEDWLDKDRLIHGMHAYSVLGVNESQKTVSVINPWNSAAHTTISFDEFKKYFDSLSVSN